MGMLPGSSLHTLELSGFGEVQLGGWLACLPRLESLEVSGATCITLALSLSQLSSLTRLGLWTSTSITAAGHSPCLPPSLVILVADGMATNLVLGPMPSLQSLIICWYEGQGWESFWSQLDMLPSLTALCYNCYEDVSSAPIPEQISALTGLRQLEFTGAIHREDGADDANPAASLAPLLPLRQLSCLCLKGCSLRAVPSDLLALSGLKVRLT